MKSSREEKLERDLRLRDRNERVRQKLLLLKRSHPAPVEKRESQVISFYARKLGLTLTGRGGRKQRVLRFPSVFSFYENPDTTLDLIERFVGMCAPRRTSSISILQEKCTVIEHSAACVANAIAIEASYRLRISFLGTVPKDQELREIIAATGIPKAIGVKVPTPEHFKTFALYKGERSGDAAKSSSHRERIATEVTNYINTCLKRYSYSLSDTAEDYLGTIMGEVLGNAEEHAGRSSWWIAGYLRQLGDRRYGDCHITIFSLGRSLSESLQTLPEDALLRQHIENLIAHHELSGHFNTSWTPEALWTVAALQEGASRRNTGSYEIGNNGQGFPNMIAFFQNLGRLQDGTEPPKMSLLSGRTQIKFTDDYPLRLEDLRNGIKRRIIAFNSENDLRQPPDPDVVRVLKRSFPGTLIGMDFFFDKGHLDRLSVK